MQWINQNWISWSIQTPKHGLETPQILELYWHLPENYINLSHPPWSGLGGLRKKSFVPGLHSLRWCSRRQGKYLKTSLQSLLVWPCRVSMGLVSLKFELPLCLGTWSKMVKNVRYNMNQLRYSIRFWAWIDFLTGLNCLCFSHFTI